MTPMVSRNSIFRDFWRRTRAREMEEIDHYEADESIDKELPRTNPLEFEKILNYFWNGVSECLFDIDIALDTLYKCFPLYRKDILKSGYYFMINNGSITWDFAILLEHMADFDQCKGSNYFGLLIDVTFDELIESFGVDTPFYDVEWILENRFLIAAEKIQKKYICLIKNIYRNHNIAELISHYTLAELFKLADGYRLFFEYVPYIMRSYSEKWMSWLEEEYCIQCNIECKVMQKDM